MNKRGFAISIILYAVIFLIIAIFYMILGIVKARYNNRNVIFDEVVNDLNSTEKIYIKVDNDNRFNILRLDPNYGILELDGQEITELTEIIRYSNDRLVIQNPTRVEDVGTFTIDYDTVGGTPQPVSRTVPQRIVPLYDFDTWTLSGDCGSFENGIYTFPDTQGTVCTITASWHVDPNTLSTSIILPDNIKKYGYSFDGWKSSVDNNKYAGGSTYAVVQNTIMTAQWIDAYLAEELGYNNAKTGLNCDNVQCAIEAINDEIDQIVQ